MITEIRVRVQRAVWWPAQQGMTALLVIALGLRSAPVQSQGVDYSTFVGGSGGDSVRGAATGPCGGVWLVGSTSSWDFPELNPVQPGFGGGLSDAFVVYLNATGQLAFATLLGGDGPMSGDWLNAIAVDREGNAWVVGGADGSLGMPLRNPFQALPAGQTDGIVAKFSPRGELLFSTYLGGRDSDYLGRIAVDGEGNAWVAGYSYSATSFPSLAALRPAGVGREGVLAKFAPDGTLLMSTFVGGDGGDSIDGVAVTAGGDMLVAGSTSSADFPMVRALDSTHTGLQRVFLTQLSGDGRSVRFSTLLGGNDSDTVKDLAVSRGGVAFVLGGTTDPAFPLVRPIQGTHGGFLDAFLVAIDLAVPEVAFSTFLGGSASDKPVSVRLSPAEEILVVGSTPSADFPLVSPLQPALRGTRDGFVARLSADGTTLLAATYVGGNAIDSASGVAVDVDGGILVAGGADSRDLPVRNAWQPVHGGGTSDGWVMRIADAPSPALPGRVGNALVVAKGTSGSDLALSWADIPVATSYDVRSGSVKDDGRLTLEGSSPSGVPGLRLLMRADPLLFFNVAGVRCGQQGPL